MPPGPVLTSVGWSLNGLVTRGPRFREIPRISVSDKNLDATIRKHESSGQPLVVEGMHEHQAWPAALFDIQWLRDNLKQHIQVRNVHNRRDLDVPFTEFLDHIKSVQNYAGVDETSRWYAKDLDCPREWKKWLDTTPLIPRSLCPHGPADIMQNLPEGARVETLMCYLGVGDTFTPCHKDLCASFGHNLMCHAEDGGSAFWFMTRSSDAWSMAKYFQSLSQELDLESHAMSIEEFAAAPCEIYITEQKVGDLVLVPPRSCHQVVNHGRLTVKMSWSRMTIKSAQVALYHELPIYRRVCRAETYRIKSTIHHTLRRNTALLEDLAKGKEGSPSIHGVFRRELANDVQTLLKLFREIILDEYCPDAEILDHITRDFNHNVYETEGYPTFTCDFCGSDIFVSLFSCKGCSPTAEKSSSVSDGLHICPGCYAEGRSCGCGKLMEPVQCWPLQILYADHNWAVRALKGVGVEGFDEIGDNGRVSGNDAVSIFEAGTIIQKWRTESIANKGTSQCYAMAQPHAVHSAVNLHCKKCHNGRCFVHLAETGIHSAEAITFYKKSLDQGPWHNLHQSRKNTFTSDKERILAAETSGDSFSSLMGQKLAITALSFPHCQPFNLRHIKFGWYDRLKSSGMAALGSSDAMDMSFPRDGGDWGSPLTDICPEDSVSNTLVGRETPPRDTEPVKLPGSATAPSSAVVKTEPMKRKRPSAVFDGVTPPERKRKTNAGHAGWSSGPVHSSRSAASMKGDEKSQGPQFAQSSTGTLERSVVQAISKIEALTTTIAEQNRKIEMLVQDNTDLRDEVRNLSQTLKLSKRDLQRVENMIPKMTDELKVKFERIVERSHGRIQGPIDRLLEELARIHPNPPAPAHVPDMTTFPPSTSFASEHPANDGGWVPREDYIPAEVNKHHYQENWEQHGQPNHKYTRGGYRPYRGRGRGSRGAYLGNRPFHRPYFPALPEGYGIVRVAPNSVPAPLEPASATMLTSVPVLETAPRHGDAYHPQGHAPPPPSQHPPTPSLMHSSSYPHPIPSTPTHTHSRPHPHAHADPQRTPGHAPAASPTFSQQQQQQQRHRHSSARPQPYEHARDPRRDRDHAREREHSQPSHESVAEFRDRDRDNNERHRTPARAACSEAGDGFRDARYAADAYIAYSPARSDEEVRWMSTPSDSVGLRYNRGQSQSGSGGTSPGRGYSGREPADDMRNGRR